MPVRCRFCRRDYRIDLGCHSFVRPWVSISWLRAIQLGARVQPFGQYRPGPVDKHGGSVYLVPRRGFMGLAAVGAASSDDPISGFLWYAYLNTVVPPMNNVHCRMA